MTDVSSLNKEPVIEAAQGLYGTINSAFEDWDSKEVPPDGYEGLFGYNVPRQAVCDVQHDDKLDLRSLGIHDLSSQGR